MKHFALLAFIVASLTACVERYPDSQYLSTYATPANNGAQDATGGGQDTAQSDTGVTASDTIQDTPFLICLKYYCAVPLAACGYNSGCLGILQCLNKCTQNDTTCQNNCYPTGGANPTFETLYTCAANSCSP